MESLGFLLVLVITSFYTFQLTICFDSDEVIDSMYDDGNCSMLRLDIKIPAERIPITFQETSQWMLAFCRNADTTMNKTYTKACCLRGWSGGGYNGKCIVDHVCPRNVYCKIPATELGYVTFDYCCGGYDKKNLYTNRTCLSNRAPSAITTGCGERTTDFHLLEDPACKKDSLKLIVPFCRMEGSYFADEFSTKHCCLQYQPTYGTRFMYEIISITRRARCVWSRDNPLHSWVMFSKMRLCCTSHEKVVHFARAWESELFTEDQIDSQLGSVLATSTPEPETTVISVTEGMTMTEPVTEPETTTVTIPEYEPVPCTKDNDLVIILDASKSTTAAKYYEVLHFASTLTSGFSRHPGNRVSIMRYGRHVYTTFPLNHNLTLEQIPIFTQPGIVKYLGATEGRSADGNLALMEATRQLNELSRGVNKNVLIIIHGAIKSSKDDLIKTKEEMKRSGIRTFAIGTQHRRYPKDALLFLADREDRTFNMFHVDSMPFIMKAVSYAICHG